MSTKGDPDSSGGTIGARTKFDWFFIVAVLPGVYIVGLKLNQIDNKLSNRVQRSELVNWSIRLQEKYPQVPIFPPQASGDDSR